MAYKKGMAIGQGLEERKVELRLSDEAAGRQLDVAGSLFGRWRKGKPVPGDDRVPDLAAFLGWTEQQVVDAIHRQKIQNGETTDLAERLDDLERRVIELEQRR